MLIPRRPEAKDERHKFHIPLGARGASPVAQLVKNPPTMRETWVQSLGWEDPLEKGTGYPLQSSGLENCMDCTVYGVTKSRT